MVSHIREQTKRRRPGAPCTRWPRQIPTAELAPTGPGSGGGTGSGTGLNGTDGDAIDVSIAAFNSVTGPIVVRDSGDFNFAMAGIDAITAANVTAGDPSDLSTTLPLNSGATSNNALSITTYGDGQGDGSAAHGLDVEYFLVTLEKDKDDGEEGRKRKWCTREEALERIEYDETRALIKKAWSRLPSNGKNKK